MIPKYLGLSFFRAGWMLCCLLLSVCLSASSDAQQISGQPSIKYQRIEVPEGELSKFPLKDWIPFRLGDFEKMIEERGVVVDPSVSTFIPRAKFSAKYVDGSLQEGSFILQVRRQGANSQFLSLSPCTLPLREISWLDRPASSGTTKEGESIVTVDRESGNLVGKWDLAGVPQGGGTEFAFEIPRASVHTLELSIPDGLEVVAGDPSAIISSVSEEPSLRVWTINLGSRTGCRFTIKPKEESLSAIPTSVSRVESYYSIRQDGVRLRTQVNLQSVSGRVREMAFQVDRELQVLSAVLGTDYPLSWDDQATDQGRIITVRLPDPMAEPGQQLQLRFASPPHISQDWQLPRVKAIGSVVEEHRLILQVEAPLELKFISPQGCRQIGIDTSDPPTRTFLADEPDASLNVFVGAPALRTGCVVSGQVQCTSEYWTGEFELEFQASSGSEFTLPVKIQPDWEIIDVRTGSTSSATLQELVHWEVADNPDRSQVLRVELQDGLRAGSSKRIYVRTRRAAPDREKEVPVPCIEPAFVVSPLQVLVRLVHDRQSSAVLEPGATYDVVTSGELPAPWSQGAFFRDRPVSADQQAFTVRLADSTPLGELFVRSTQTNLTGTGTVLVDFSEDRIQEQFSLKIVPQGRIERILVYLSDAGEELTWLAGNSATMFIDAVRLPTSRHGIWKVPPQGALWELNLSSPQSEPFELRGFRTAPRDERGRIALPWLPQADHFEGEVRITTTGPDVPKLETQGGETLEFDRQPRGPNRSEPRTASWKYVHSIHEDFSSSISYFSTENIAAASMPVAAASVLIRPGRNHLSSDLYEIDYTFPLPVPVQQVNLTLPDGAELIDSTIDSSQSETSRRGTELFFFSSSLTEGRRFRVKYSLQTPTGVTRSLSFPVSRFAISKLDWTLIIPDGLALAEWPSALGTSDQQPPPVWRQLGDSTSSHGEPTPFGLDGFGELQPGDRIWTGQGLSLPPVAQLHLWNRSFFVPLAWLSFLTLFGFRLISRGWGIFTRRPGLIPGIVVCAGLSLYWIPPGWSFVVFSGMIGLLFGTVVPRWWIPRSFRDASGPQRLKPVEQTRLIVQSEVLGAILFLGLQSTILHAQTTPASSSPSTTTPAVATVRLPQVLIPLPESGSAPNAETLIYLSPEWKSRLESIPPKLPENGTPAYWIHSSRHELEMNVNGLEGSTYRLKLDLEVADPTRDLDLVIPSSNLRFGGIESCRVDGTPASMFNIPGTSSVRITLVGSPPLESSGGGSSSARKPVRKLIELQGYPVIQGNELEWSWESQIVSVQDSRLAVKFNGPARQLRVADARGFVQWNADRTEMEVSLGAIPKLNVTYSNASADQPVGKRIDLTAVGRLEIGAEITNARYRLKFNSPVSPSEELPLLLPPGAIIRDVSMQGIPVPFTVGDHESGSLLKCRLADSLPQSPELLLWFQLGRVDEAESLTIPAVPFELSRQSESGVRVSEQLVGISARTDWLLEGPRNSGETLTRIGLEDFQLAWGDDSTPPQVAVRMTAPQSLIFRKSNVKSGLAVSEERFVIGIDPHRANFLREWSVSLQASQPQFEYEIQVSDDGRIENVAVTEDGANRLLNWSRKGDRLRIFLREPTTGAQRISVTMSSLLRIPGELKIPELRLLNSNRTDCRVDVTVNPGLSVSWIDDRELTLISQSGASELNANGEVRLGSWKIPAGHNRSLAFRIESNVPQIVGYQATMVEKQLNAWRITTHLLYRVSRGYATSFQLRIPTSMPSPAIEASGAVQNSEPPAGESGTLVTLTPTVAVNDSFHVRITSEISPPKTARWTVPRISTPDVDMAGSFVLVHPAELIEDSDPSESGLRSGTLLPELAEFFPTEVLSASRVFEAYREVDSWVLPIRSPVLQTGSNAGILAENSVTVFDGGRIAGRLSAVLNQIPGRKVEIAFPSVLTPNRVLVNGYPQEIAMKDGRLTVRWPGTTDLNLIEIDWVQEKVNRSPLPVSMRLFLPRVLSSHVNLNLAVLDLPQDRYHLGTVEGKATDWWEFVLRRNEWLASIPQSPRFGGKSGETLLEQLQAAENLQRSNGHEAPTSDQLDRLNQLRSRLEALAGTPNPSPVSINLSYPHPESSLIYLLGPDEEFVAVRTASSRLLWGFLTTAGILFAFLILRRISRGWMNDFADRIPILGWICCGLLWFLCCSPAWFSTMFLFLAFATWWMQEPKAEAKEDLFLPVQEDLTASSGTAKT